MQYKNISKANNQHLVEKSPNLVTLDTNPGLLFLMRMRCPLRHAVRAGCQLVCLYIKNPNLGTYSWRALE
jgi:hypothetical protein